MSQSGNRSQDSVSKKLVRFPQKDSGFSQKDSGFSQHDSGFSQDDSGCSQIDSGFSQIDPGFSQKRHRVHSESLTIRSGGLRI